MTRRFRTFLTWLGRLLALGGIVFVGFRLDEAFRSLPTHWFTLGNLSLLIPLTFVLFLANYLLAGAWHNIMVWLHRRNPFLPSLNVYARSQLGKYLPGNVFQFAGRQSLGMEVGFPKVPLAKSIFLEILLISVAGAAIGAVAGLSYLNAVSAWQAIAICAVVLALAITWSVATGRRRLAVALLFYVLYLLTTGAVFVLSLTWFGEGQLIRGSLILVVSGYVLGWLAGLLTPGAPAGIGVREAVLAGLLNGLVPLNLLMLCIVLMRIVSILGDVVFFLVSGIRYRGLPKLKGTGLE